MKHLKKLPLLVGFLTISGLVWYGMGLQPTKQQTLPSPVFITTTQSSGDTTPTLIPAASSSGASNSSNSTPTTPPPHEKASAYMAAPKQLAIKKTIHKEYLYHALRASNDPLTQRSWALGAVHASSAWDTTTGNGVIVAVIDTGFALSHQDLSSQWHTNTSEIGTTSIGDDCWTGLPASKSTNGCDDDNNGYVDDWRGWDFVAQNNSPQAGDDDPNGEVAWHGTSVAGLVGATGNNNTGIATVSWNNILMPLQALDDDGNGYTSDVVAAVYYAVENGASVINMSLGGTDNDPALADAINYAYAHDVVVVAAAGNCGTGQEQGCDAGNPGAMGYPALNAHVISVGASDSTNTRAGFSSYGSGLDVMAPGSGNIISTAWSASNGNNLYATSLYGTSFASPFVASYVGLIKSLRPASSVDDVTAIVDATARKVGGMNSALYTTMYGHGLINVTDGIATTAALATPSANTPILYQTGNQKAEHHFTSGTGLTSGCVLSAGSPCTVYALDDNSNERYLPYRTSDVNGNANWSWPGSTLGTGEWTLRARSGEATSPPYVLLYR